MAQAQWSGIQRRDRESKRLLNGNRWVPVVRGKSLGSSHRPSRHPTEISGDYWETHVLLADAVVEGNASSSWSRWPRCRCSSDCDSLLRVEGESVVQRLVGYSRKSVRLLVFSSSSPDFPSSNPIRGAPYSFDFRALGGSGTYSRTLVSGSLPVGLSPDPASGIISGTPFENGSFSATYLITSDALQLLWNFGINVGSPTNPAISMPGWGRLLPTPRSTRAIAWL